MTYLYNLKTFVAKINLITLCIKIILMVHICFTSFLFESPKISYILWAWENHATTHFSQLDEIYDHDLSHPKLIKFLTRRTGGPPILVFAVAMEVFMDSDNHYLSGGMSPDLPLCHENTLYNTQGTISYLLMM